jgi:hypothetical protein
MVPCIWGNELAIIIGTGPSLASQAAGVLRLKAAGARLFGVNNTHQDFPLDAWIACDPAWHRHYGQVRGDFDKWHWDKGICQRYGYRYIKGLRNPDGSVLEGRGLSLDPNCITLGHSSGWQALNLAVLYGCSPILLVGYDMTYRDGEPRHYFGDLSDVDGEYPQPLRKYSLFDKPNGTGLLHDYRDIAQQPGLPPIINCTPRSAMRWFPMGELAEYG